jgi:hypothetical protein
MNSGGTQDQRARIQSLAQRLYGPDAAERFTELIHEHDHEQDPSDPAASGGPGAIEGQGANVRSAADRTSHLLDFTEADVVTVTEAGWPSGPDKSPGGYLFEFLDDELEGSIGLYHVPHPRDVAHRQEEEDLGDSAQRLPGERFGFGVDLQVVETATEELRPGREEGSGNGARGSSHAGSPEPPVLRCSVDDAASVLHAVRELAEQVERGLRMVRVYRAASTREENEADGQSPRAETTLLYELLALLLGELVPGVAVVMDTALRVEAGSSLVLVEDAGFLSSFQRAVAEEDGRYIEEWLEARHGTTPYAVLPYRQNILAELIDPALPETQRARRVSLSFALLLSLPGIPALSADLITARENDRAREYPELVDSLHTEGSLQNLVLEYFKRLVSARALSPAFHPQAPYEVVESARAAFVLLRREPNGTPVICFHNVTAEVAELSILARRLEIPPKSSFIDLITGDYFYPTWEGQERFSIDLEPEEVMWLTLQA